MDANIGKALADLVFLFGCVCDTTHLLAVAQRGIIDAQLFGIGKAHVARDLARIADQFFNRLAKLHGDSFLRCGAWISSLSDAPNSSTALAGPHWSRRALPRYGIGTRLKNVRLDSRAP